MSRRFSRIVGSDMNDESLNSVSYTNEISRFDLKIAVTDIKIKQLVDLPGDIPSFTEERQKRIDELEETIKMLKRKRSHYKTLELINPGGSE